MNWERKFLFIFWALVYYLRNPRSFFLRILKIIKDLLRSFKNPTIIYKDQFYPGSSTKRNFFYHQIPFENGSRFCSCRENSIERLNVLRLHEDFAGKRVLDLGCNVGFFTFSLAREAKEVVGVDYDKVAIKKAKEIAKRYNIENVNFIAENITTRLLKNLGEFDVVLALAVLPWINKTSKNSELIWRIVLNHPVVYVELMYKNDGLAGMDNVSNDEEAKLLLESYCRTVHPIGFTKSWGNRTLWRCVHDFGTFKNVKSGFQSVLEMSEKFIKKSKGGIFPYSPKREFKALKALISEGIAPIPVELTEDFLIITRLQGRPFDLDYPRDKAKKEFKRIVQALRKREIVHRDIRPENLFVGRDDRIYLLDFAWAVVQGEWYEVPKNLGGKYHVKDFDNKKSFDLILRGLK